MNPDSIPQAEDRLLARLRAFGLLEPPADPGLDDLAALATRVADAAGAILLACDGENCRLIARHGVSPAVSKEILAAAAPFARDLALAVEESPAPAGSDSMAIRVVAGAPLKDADGTVLGAFCILDRKAHSPDPGLLAALESLARQAMHRIQARRDRSELARARIRLGELTNPSWNDGLRRAVIDALPAHVALLDAEGTILAVNRAWIEFGRANRLPDPEMAVGQNYLEVCRQSATKPLDDAGQVLAGIASVLAGETAEFSHEYPCDGPAEQRWFRLMVTPAGRDRIEGAVVMHIDITDRKRTEAILERERNLSDSIINSLPGVFYLFDAEGRFLRWNRNFETVTGYSSAEFARLHPLDLFAGSDKQVIADGIAEVFHMGTAHAEASLVPKKGMPVPYYFTGLKVTHEGRPCLLGMGIDIADRKHVEQERDRLFNLSADLLCVAGFDGVFKQLNPAWERT
ncbi:MAG: PAS domain S-box protein, partial [Puniceicoccaceae bacterium]